MNRLECVPIRVTLELYAKVISVEENVGRPRRIDGLVVQTTRYSVPEGVAEFLSIRDVPGGLRVKSPGEFESDTGVIAEILAVDSFGLDCAILDDVDEVVNLSVVLGIDLDLEEFRDGCDGGLKYMLSFER